MIKMEVERDIVVETDILCVDRVMMHYAYRKGDDPLALPPYEEADFVPHPPPQIAEVLFRELLEVQFRTLIDLEIQWKDLRDHRRGILDYTHLERGGPC